VLYCDGESGILLSCSKTMYTTENKKKVYHLKKAHFILNTKKG
jgi:hypothetical protein